MDDDEFDDAYGTFDEMPCPHCGGDIPDDVTRCPLCGEDVNFETSLPSGSRQGCAVIGVAVAAIIVVLVIALAAPAVNV